MPAQSQLKSVNPKKGFTLIELMIVISIIAIMSAVGIYSYSKAQELGRDAKRKQDLRSIATALELYYQKNKRYPETSSVAGALGVYWQDSRNGGFWINDYHTPAVPLDTNYISVLPSDPKNTVPNVYNYYSWPNDYGTTCKANKYYFLATNLENTADPDLYAKNPFPICGQPGWCTTQNNCQQFIIAGGG